MQSSQLSISKSCEHTKSTGSRRGYRLMVFRWPLLLRKAGRLQVHTHSATAREMAAPPCPPKALNVICVALPYFQRQPGVLRKALLSVAAQQGNQQPVKVMLEDDASPVPVEGELAGIDRPAGTSSKVIQQTNAGPGGARNAGLDAVPEACAYVTFPGSDSEYSTKHLERAVAALKQGFDFLPQGNATRYANLDYGCLS
jgi:hypothetical protein